MRKGRWWVSMSWVVLLAGCAGGAGFLGDGPSIASTPDTKFVCGGDAPECFIVVAVESKAVAGGCEANVDIDDIRIKITKSNGSKVPKPVKFLLMRKSMSESDRFEFVGNGLVWVDSANPPQPLTPQPVFANEFEFISMAANNTQSEWKAIKKHTSKQYRPAVRRVGSTVNCFAPDPKIANDG